MPRNIRARYNEFIHLSDCSERFQRLITDRSSLQFEVLQLLQGSKVRDAFIRDRRVREIQPLEVVHMLQIKKPLIRYLRMG